MMDDQVDFLLLGAGPPARGETPSALARLGERTRVLDWLLQAVRPFCDRTFFVGGYRIDEVQSTWPDLGYVHNEQWEETGSTGSFFEAPLGESDRWLVSYSDIVYRRSLVESMLEQSGDIVIGIDTEWTERYRGRSEEDLQIAEKVTVAGEQVTRFGSSYFSPEQADAEFIGVVDIRAAAVSFLKDLDPEKRECLATTNFSGLLEHMRIRGFDIRVVDAAGNWAELNSSEDLARFVLGTKAQTLNRLRPVVEKSEIEEQVAFTVSDWEENPSGFLRRIQSEFEGKPLIVRSSATTEDGFATSNAGTFTSVLDVDGMSEKALTTAVDDVIDSYGDGDSSHQVLVQPMVRESCASGVVLTRTLEEGAPYYVVTYDSTSGATDTVTDGSGSHDTLFVRRDRALTSEAVPETIQALLEAIREIEALVGSEALDIEFAVDQEETVHILQVRPLSTLAEEASVREDEAFLERLDDLSAEVAAAAEPVPHLKGEEGVFGVMPDWNPAEMIGRRPRPLALSLYQHLITDSVWAQQRAEFGYKDVRPAPLLALFGGQPFVDVRASLNSFVPAGLDEEYTEALVRFCLDRLRRYPELHDKIEFEIIPTCFALNFGEWERLLIEEAGLSRSGVAAHREALVQITQEAFARVDLEHRRIETLANRRRDVIARELPPLKEAAMLLKDCRRLGTLPFAHLARCAFVAVTLLRSAEAAGIVSEGFEEKYLRSVQTVSQELTRDSAKVAAGEMSWERLVETYGHLRPGTYDITAPAYRDAPEQFLGPLVERVKEDGITCEEEFDHHRLAPIAAALHSEGIEVECAELDTFLRRAIEGREVSKFEFTRNLSRALDRLVAFGETVGLDRDDLSYCRVEDLLSLTRDGLSRRSAGERLHRRAEEGREWHRHGEGIQLPALLTGPKEVNVFRRAGGEPNFVGCETVRAKAVDLEDRLENCSREATQNGDFKNGDFLSGRVVCLPQADPGYDWIFGRGIAGLVTMYGGANSHMAIRAAEFELPAAIGVGEARFAELRRGHVLELAPAHQRVRVLNGD